MTPLKEGDKAPDFKIKNELGWEPKTNIDKGLRNTINWYLND